MTAARGAVVAASIVGLAAAGCREREVPADAHLAIVAGSAAASPRALYSSGPGSFVDVVDGARHGVVAIRAAAPVKSGPAAMFPGAAEATADVALGTGFLVEANGVYVLTTDHIAAASSELHVVVEGGTEVPAKLVGRDVRLDIALLQVDVPRLHALPLGNSDDLKVGEWLVVLGDAFGDEVTASAGVVSATGRDAAGSRVAEPAMGFRTFIETDARIHRGNSGGPVLDTAGEVVGVAVATSDRPGELSFAIPINRVKEVVGALRDYGQVSRSWLGVLVKPVTGEQADALGLPRPTGALVTEIKTGSPAMRAAIRVGDVIVRWDGHDADHRSLPYLVAATPPNKQITVQLVRNRTPVDITIVTEKMPE